jgi:5-formyltetrahydrofolate cyclo-ligase
MADRVLNSARCPGLAALIGLPSLAARRLNCVAAYASYGTEPATDELIAELLSAGIEVRLPRMQGPDLAWARVGSHAELIENDRGIREPAGPDVGLTGVDVVLVPALGVTRTGDRLGQGAGFYDRALSGIPRATDGGPLLVAVVYSHEVHDEPTWPVEPHDIRIDEVITVG